MIWWNDWLRLMAPGELRSRGKDDNDWLESLIYFLPTSTKQSCWWYYMAIQWRAAIDTHYIYIHDIVTGIGTEIARPKLVSILLVMVDNTLESNREEDPLEIRAYWTHNIYRTGLDPSTATSISLRGNTRFVCLPSVKCQFTTENHGIRILWWILNGEQHCQLQQTFISVLTCEPKFRRLPPLNIYIIIT